MNDRILEVSIKVYNPTCPLIDLDAYIKINDLRSNGDFVAHLVELPKDKFENARSLARNTDSIIRFSEQGRDTVTCQFLSRGCEVCKPISYGDAFLITGKLLGDGSMEYNFIVTGEDAYKRILDELKRAGIKFDVVRVYRFKNRRVLTNKQEKLLYIALKMGLFDHPRKITVRQLAELLGVKPSTLTESLRRGLKRVLRSYFE
jgi:hypothetical protein